MGAIRGAVSVATIAALACAGGDPQEQDSAEVPVPGLGIRLEVESLAPNDDKVDVKVRGYHLSLTREDAGRISVEVDA